MTVTVLGRLLFSVGGAGVTGLDSQPSRPIQESSTRFVPYFMGDKVIYLSTEPSQSALALKYVEMILIFEIK